MCELTMERREAIMAYCRIDELAPEEALLFEGIVQAAMGYLGPEPEAGTPRRAQYDLCVNAMVLDAWDRRGTAGAEKSAVENPSFRRMINQLKLT